MPTPEDVNNYIQIFNLIAPHVFHAIGSIKQNGPNLTYAQVLEQAGIELDAEHVRLMSDLAADIAEGAK